MDDFTLARVIHIVAVLMWIGGVAFVTTVVMPSIRRSRPTSDPLSAFHALENGFAWQARIWVVLAGVSGFWMTWRADLWSRFTDPQFWWMWAMLLIWAIFAAMLFVAEPLFLHKRMAASPQPEKDFQIMEWMHRILLVASILATVGAVGGSHGLW